ncbi:MAG: molybdate transport system ATP-binding protein [Pseudoalteromonas distincta]|jgi:molybdate transport system ATP-binding protein
MSAAPGTSATGLIEASFRGRLGAFALNADFITPAAGVTVLFGPSGCGKTTLLRCIAGLERLPGRLVVEGEIWQDEARFLPAHQRPVGYVFQEASLLAHLSVRRNLLFGFRRTKDEQRIDLDQVVGLLGLEPLLERGVARLSGGERQRVAIGRALLSQPRLLLMDEPLASLDRARKAEVLPYLERLNSDLAIPILYVTHDLAEAARLGDRQIALNEGQTGPVIDSRDGAGDAGLGARLAEVGPDRLFEDLCAGGAPPELAQLTLAALLAGLPPWRAPDQPA